VNVARKTGGNERAVAAWRTLQVSLSAPWGEPPGHQVDPRELLGLPLAFTQNPLLTPEEFTSRARDRGVGLRVEHLAELHRRRALVPLLRIVQRPSKASPIVPVAASAVNGYGQYRSPIALVTAAASGGLLVNPGAVPYRPWDGGLPLPTHHGFHRYPSVFYSPYQLLALKPAEQLISEMSATLAANGKPRFSLRPLTPGEAARMDGGRQLAVLLGALDMRYLPQILLTAHHAHAWEKEDPGFDPALRLEMFGLAPETIAATAEALLLKGKSIDPMREFYELVRQANPGTWADLRGDALLAMDYRIAAEILLRTLDDLGRSDLSARPPRKNRMYESTLDERLQAEPERLDEILASRGLSPHPAVLLVLEGETEMLLMPRVLAELYGKPVPSTLIELVNMKTIDQKLDLFVRHVASPRLGDNQTNDTVLLTRPPSRILVAVDPEKKYADRASVRGQRDMLVRRLHEALPASMRSATTLRQLRPLVDVVTWGTAPWEFANFTNTELAKAIMQCTTLPPCVTRRGLVTALAAERNIRSTNARRSPDVEALCLAWPVSAKFRKTELAEQLWPVLRQKVQRDISSGRRLRVPAARVAVKALTMAFEFPRYRSAILVR
jgi:hypothetical protein